MSAQMNIEERVNQWLNEQLTADTNGTMCLSFVPQSEDVKFSPDEMLDLIQSYNVNHHIGVREYFVQYLGTIS